MIRKPLGRTLAALFLAVVVSALGVAMTAITGSKFVGWALVPGGMLAVGNMTMDGYAGLWFYGGAIGNVALWTFLAYAALDMWNDHRQTRSGVA